MRVAMCVAAILLATVMSGCLADTVGNSDTSNGEGTSETQIVGTNAEGETVRAGEDLGTLTFHDEGEMNSAVTQPDCAQGSGSAELHHWILPAQNEDGIDWKASKVTVTVTKSESAVDLDVYLRMNNQVLASSTETGPDEGDTITVTAFNVYPGDLEIRVQACTSAFMATYTVDGEADMVAVTEKEAASPAATGAVTIEQKVDGNGDIYYVATRQESYSAELTGTTGKADLSTGAGNIDYDTRSGSDYDLLATLTARGDSEQEARDRLAEMSIDHTAESGVAVLLNVHGRPGGDGSWNRKQIDLDITAPEAIDWTTHSTDVAAGNVLLDGVTGEVITVGVAAGNIDIKNTDAGNLVVTASAGNILIATTTADDMKLLASAGNIIAAMDASDASGTWDMDSSAGNIELTVKETADIGYDVDGRVAAGTITYSFKDTTDGGGCQYAGCHKTAKTDGYDSRSVKVVVDMDISAGNIIAGS